VRIESRVAALPHSAPASNAYHGVGRSDRIHGGVLTAERIPAAN
jgi:hypothetical protein